MLNHNSQWQPLSPNENRSISHRNREPYNNFKRGTNNRTQTLTTQSPVITHSNLADRFHHFSCTMPEVTDIYHQNLHFTNYTYQAAQIRGYAYHAAPFRMINTSHEQQDFQHRGSSRSDGLLYSTFPMNIIIMACTAL